MRPPRGGHLDANHRAVVDALRKFGALVKSLAGVGDGCADLLVAYRDTLVLLEVKDGSKPPSERQLTQAEAKFIAEWPKAYVVTSPDDAIRAVVEAAKPSHSETR